jgi:chemotaxis response regulator CheB
MTHYSTGTKAAMLTLGNKRMKKKPSSSRRQKKPVPTLRLKTSAAPTGAPFPIVGIGASADGSGSAA